MNINAEDCVHIFWKIVDAFIRGKLVRRVHARACTCAIIELNAAGKVSRNDTDDDDESVQYQLELPANLELLLLDNAVKMRQVRQLNRANDENLAYLESCKRESAPQVR